MSIDQAPPALMESMGQNWRDREAFKAEMARRAAEADG
jgi:hypothetical protein